MLELHDHLVVVRRAIEGLVVEEPQIRRIARPADGDEQIPVGRVGRVRAGLDELVPIRMGILVLGPDRAQLVAQRHAHDVGV